MRTPDEILKAVTQIAGGCIRAHGGFRHGNYVGFCQNCEREVSALYASEQAATQALREALNEAERWLNAWCPVLGDRPRLDGLRVRDQIATALTKESSRPEEHRTLSRGGRPTQPGPLDPRARRNEIVP